MTNATHIQPVRLPLRFTDDFIAIVDENGATIAEMDSTAAPSVSKEETLKFAALFAAAPELLEALKELLFMTHPDTFGGSMEEAQATAAAAIAKAKAG